MPKTVIDSCVSSSGWSITNGTIAIESHKEFATSFLGSQIRFTFTSAGIASKDFASILPKETFAFSIVASRNEIIQTVSDYSLKVKFYNDLEFVEYYVPISTQFVRHTFYPGDLSKITKIEFISTKAVDVMISEILTYTDQFPLDVYDGIKELIESKITVNDLMSIGTITASAGDKEVFISGAKYIDKYSIIKFGNETHQVTSKTGDGKVKFSKNYNGVSVIEEANNLPVYLQVPIIVENNMYEAFLPSIALTSAFAPEQKEEMESYSPLIDSLSTSDTLRTFFTGITWCYKVTITGQSRHQKTDEIILGIIKRSCNGMAIFYINGRRCELHCKPLESLDFSDATDILSRINLEVEAWVTEETWETAEIQPATNLNLAVSLGRLNS